ncbi:MAG: hypothetical protein M3O62_08665 [Pseudomonadota bacterium]|nr:hypothetical protein [Pseudomonadota bacterium]
MKAALVSAALLLSGMAEPALAQQVDATAEIETASDAPAFLPIVEISYSGNDVTRPQVLQRELVIKPGDPADPALIERSRQGLLDLGLFRSVQVEEQAVDGGVRILFKLDERYYLLPTPRFDAKSDGRYTYGAQLAWSNVGGRNHSLRAYIEQEETQREGVGKETAYAARYVAPFAFGSPYALSVSGSYLTRPVRREDVEFEESFRNTSVGVSRTFSDGAASQGLTLGGGLGLRQQRTSGAAALPAYGTAIAPSVFVSYRDFHYRVYSDVGEFTSLGASFADEDMGSDYNFVDLNTTFVRQYAVGNTEHQTLHFKAYAGAYFNGPDEVEAYALGGASNLRSYEVNFLEGNAYYYVTAEFARPVWKRWLRAVVMIEAGNVFARPEDMDFDEIYGSIGAGLRFRFTHFVNLEIEVGYALPLNGGSGRVFAGGI